MILRLPFMFLILICFLSLPGCGNLEDYPSPTSCFIATFDKSPGPSITHLQGQGKGFRDWDIVFLTFKVPPAEFKTMFGKIFRPISLGQFQSGLLDIQQSKKLPSWWKPMSDSPTVFLHCDSFKPVENSNAWVSYDPVSQVTHIYWDAFG